MTSCTEENIGIKLLDLGFRKDFINLTSKNKRSKNKKTTKQKTKQNKTNQTKKLLHSKGNH